MKDMDSPDMKDTPRQQRGQRKRRPSTPEDADAAVEVTPRRPKRAKYTAVACNECKKRKLRCVPLDGTTCERCLTRNVTCVFGEHPHSITKVNDGRYCIQTLGDGLAELRQQVAQLSEVVRELQNQPTPSTKAINTGQVLSPSNTSKVSAPKDPQFIGPTRAAYGLMVAERSLTRMGIPGSLSQSASGAQSPSPSEPERDEAADVGFWSTCTASELRRLMSVFEEEVETVYPFTDIMVLAQRTPEILNLIRRPTDSHVPHQNANTALTSQDVDMAKIAAATGVAIEARGKTDVSAAIADSVEINVGRISKPKADLKNLQILLALSIYYFHSDDELLAWRTIGVAARDALEIGLHRKASLVDNFDDGQSRSTAMRVFWCCYVLDRRWSFGTSLSFAFAERDIDPTLPEPAAEYSYLKCMVGYARLCSKLWDAIPPLGAPNRAIPSQTAKALDLNTQAWVNSIPPDLQLRHPHSSSSQSRVVHRLRALLHLRGNITRISIYQHHLLSTASINANLSAVWLIVDIARDSIQVLVHLNATTDIYSRQQNAFNYFLLSAVAVIALAVCHAPEIFAATCARSFLDAVGLVRGFSSHSMASRRLWKSIRGLLPRLRSLGLHGEMRQAEAPPASASQAYNERGAVLNVRGEPHPIASKQDSSYATDTAYFGKPYDSETVTGAVPHMADFSSDLMDIFYALDDGMQFTPQFATDSFEMDDAVLANTEGTGISRRFFQGLI